MTSKAAALTTRQSSTAIPPVKPRCKIHSTAIIADKAQITGSHIVEIGENVIIHPHARIKAEHGNVFIGRGCQIAEKAVVGAGEPTGSSDAADMVIGEGVSIETSAVVEAQKVGDYTTLEVKSSVGRGAVVGKWCKVAPMCEVREQEVLEDYTVVFGDGQKGRRVDGVLRDRKEVRDAKLKGKAMEMEVLKGLIPDSQMKWTMG
ncbi:hypothetical protein LTR37_000855 [Vermiconidia calcicola]|uniref:Uncharacterized protein n=1 Tax=Vermiconidia calcicola TaxID=1690605 RepID=A0ACC3NWY8_9PEZI|nr:hypothetical protein LTR37_000855 [Vermiconidia calcicola]